ncbi:hypothetical protein TNCV_3647201 [Trichonephila clavipes]|nr:hypothetical protein TNCV_3647201 [Trichonephila clavipes]
MVVVKAILLFQRTLLMKRICADGAKLCTNVTEPSASNKSEHSMTEAVLEAVDENDGKRDLAVAVDDSW